MLWRDDVRFSTLLEVNEDPSLDFTIAFLEVQVTPVLMWGNCLL